jgi:hypothetical protein
MDAKVHHWDGRSRADSSVPATRATHSPHGDKNALRCQSPGDVGGAGASERVASEAARADDARRVHTRHKGALRETRKGFGLVGTFALALAGHRCGWLWV